MIHDGGLCSALRPSAWLGGSGVSYLDEIRSRSVPVSGAPKGALFGVRVVVGVMDLVAAGAFC